MQPRLRCAGFDAAVLVSGTDVSAPPASAPPDLVIRTAVRDDVDVVLSFIRQLAEYERLASEVEATREALDTTLFGDHPAAEVLIARVGGQDVGFALFFGTYSTFLASPCMHLEDLFVVPDARGRGIGHALLARVAAIADARGCGRLQWNVLAWNAPALAFYRRLGAFSLDEWQTFRLNRQGLQALAASGGIAPTPTP